MRKLLSANFSRLWKSRIFGIAALGTGLWGLFMFGMFLYNVHRIGELFMQSNAHVYFFYVLLYIGAVMAVLTSLFVGTEYAEGTLRNKLTVGHPRRAIYLSNLLVVCAAGLLLYAIHFLTSLVCVPFVGIEMYSYLAQPLRRILFGVSIILCYAALFVMMAMLDSAKARCAVISLLVSLALIFSGMLVYGRVTMEETKMQMVLMADGSYERQFVPNPRYLTGTTRVVYEWIDACMPGSQALHIASADETPPVKGVLCLLGLSCAITVAGVTLFKKKDIR